MSNSMKVYELANSLGVKSVFLMDKMRKEWNLPVKSHMEILSSDLVKKIQDKFHSDQKSSSKSSSSSKASKVKRVVRSSGVKKIKKAPAKPTATSSVKKSMAEKPAAPKPRSRVIRRKEVEVKQLTSFEDAAAASADKKLSKDVAPSQSQTSKEAGKQDGSDLVFVKKGNSFRDLFVDAEGEKTTQEPYKKPVKKAIVEKEIVNKFTSTDFRKREVVFQPKKKRILTSGEFKNTQVTTPKAHKRILKVDGDMKIKTVCKKIGVKYGVFMRKLKSQGIDTKDLDVLDFDTIALIVPEFDFEAKNVKKTEKGILKSQTSSEETKEANSSVKAPVVTIMGHVDHGKTTLLDTIRKTKVVEKEAGGITQHIGAYSVSLNDKLISFIDTPGHEAFTAMRARGAKVTDIVIIVVAADDGVMPQTVEAINHAKSAKIPIIVAVTKMDVQGAQPDKIKQQMAEHEIVSEDWGGDVSFIPVSALKGEGIKELLEQINFIAEIQELKYYPENPAQGVVLEARLEKGRGCVVGLLVQDGILKSGDHVVAGTSVGKVRQMTNDQGKVVKEVVSGLPIEVIGFSELPQLGDSFNVVINERASRELQNLRKEKEKVKKESEVVPLTIEELLDKTYLSEGKKELNIILKVDVKGGLEDLKSSLEKLDGENVSLKIVHSGVGAITESDILLASSTGGIVLGFNVRLEGKASQVARSKSIQIYTYSTIYDLLDSTKKMMIGLLDPEFVEEDTGQAEVRNIFNISKLGTVAGSYVTQGTIKRNSFVRLVRDGRLVHDGRIASLRRVKDDVKEVNAGLECGIVIENFNDVKPKDVLEVYIKKEVARSEL